MKEPHNYRKVGYSMIVISVSLTIIGLVVWTIGTNYHFASDLMAGQEIDAMTPKKGYSIISFDDSQPVGSKLKLLDHAETNQIALQLKEQYANSETTILIFDSLIDDNKKLIENTRSAAVQIAQEKTLPKAVTTNATSTTQNTPQAVLPTGQEGLTLTEKVNTTATKANQTATIGSQKSVNLNEIVGITVK